MQPSFLVVHKPAGITSHDVVAAIRAVVGVKKVGHTGTLDPFAIGVLPLALEGATRLIQYLDESIKVYDAVVRFGAATDTGDPTGQTVRTAPLPTLERGEVETLFQKFLGPQMQRPPAYSAVKLNGRHLYDYARAGEEAEVPARPITIHHLELLDYSQESMRVVITCSRGTYARVLADDLATAMGSAGHLEHLERAQSGPFLLPGALTFPRLAEISSAEPGRTWEEVLMARQRSARLPWRTRDEVRADLAPMLIRPVQALGHLPAVEVKPDIAKRVLRGGSVPPAPDGVAVGGRYMVVSGDELLAIAELRANGPVALLRMDG